jgi:hypothetical protein
MCFVMKKLSDDWFIEGSLDFEYKKYILLAYLQHVSQQFAEVKLYPAFSELIFHYRNLSLFRDNQQKLRSRFPSRLNEEELQKLRLTFELTIEEGEDLKEIDAIISYALPSIQTHIREGKGIYDEIDEKIQIEPIGITPLYKNEGYLFFRVENRKEVEVYHYRIVFFENVEANYHGISLKKVSTYSLGLAYTYEAIKRELVSTNRELPNPATFLIFSPFSLPREATLFPIAKRKFLSYLK